MEHDVNALQLLPETGDEVGIYPCTETCEYNGTWSCIGTCGATV